MSEAQTALPKLKAGYRQWSDSKGASIADWAALMADHVHFGPIDGAQSTYEWMKPAASREDAARYLAGVTESFDMLAFEMDRFVCEGDTIVAIGTSAWRHKISGKEMTTPLINVWRFKDGLAVSVEEFFDTARAIEASM